MGSTLLALRVAVSVVQARDPLCDDLPWVLRQGGDTDTQGAIVGAQLGARDGMEGIPCHWRGGVERESRVLELGEALLARSALVHAST